MGRLLAELADAIASDTKAHDVLHGLPGSRTRVSADITTRTRSNGHLRLRRFYWSAQRWRDGASADFAARTLAYYAKSGDAAWHTFPDDPNLASAGRVLARARGLRVLRYVPLRRLTFYCEDVSGAPVITKIKRPDRYGDAAERLRIVEGVVAAASVSFKVAALRGVQPTDCLFMQSVCDGDSLADVMTVDTATDRLAQVGRILAELHGLPDRGLPTSAVSDTLASAQETTVWLARLIPGFADRLSACADILVRLRPGSEAPVFCHGDFVCSQLLVAPGGYSVVDFDLCHSGSRYRDIAVMLASLRTDVTCLADEDGGDALETSVASAEQACLAAYADRAWIRLDPVRLNWHRACAQVHYLMLMLKKDGYTPEAFAAGVGRLEVACRTVESFVGRQ